MQDCNISGIKDQKVRSSIYSLLGLLANISLQSNQHQKVLSQYNALCASIEKKKKRKKLLSHFYEIFNSQKTSILKLVTDRFHAAMCLFSNRSKMTPKCDKSKKRHKRCSWVCHRCSYHFLSASLIYYYTDPQQHEIYLFQII